MLSAVQHAREVRMRLMNPTNAKPDDGIDLKRKPKPKLMLQIIEQKPEEVQTVTPAPDPAPPSSDQIVANILQRMNTLGDEMERLHQEYAQLTGRRRPAIREIQKAVSSYYGVKMNDLLSSRRDAHVVRARQVSMYLCRELTLYSLPAVGRQTGGRDHTTVLHACRKIAALVAVNEELRQDIENLSKFFPPQI